MSFISFLNGLAIYLLVGVLAGLIAYLGNHVGRRVGRSRMTVFGLRPRHTSNLITTLTGTFIAWGTLTILAIGSQQVRALLIGIDHYKQEIRTLQDEKARIEAEFISNRIVWGVGEPILLWTANPGDPSRVIKTELLSALTTANAMSIAKNDKIAQQQSQPPIPADSQLLEIDDRLIEAKIRDIQSRGQVTGIRIVSARNCLYQQRVKVNIELQPVRLVFHSGEVIARKVVRKSNLGQFLREWYGFLGMMRENALKSGMEEINDSLGGGLTNEDFDRLVQEISRLHGRGELAAVARRDLYESMPLDVRVEMRAAPALAPGLRAVPLVQGVSKP